jgi:CHAT domain-containing protein
LKPSIRSDSGRDRFLDEDYEIVYGPSASGLLHLAGRRSPEAFPRDFLGIANPYALRALGWPEREDVDFPRLPYGSREIRTIRGLFGRDRTFVLLGKEAREDAFKALPLSDFRIIHIAAHGFFDDRNGPRSALLLLRDPAGNEDGLIQSNDVLSLKLRPDLLVLSGCETGIGRLEKGEGLSGLSLAFFIAGARSILLSLWSVNDKAASVFMESFYRGFTEGMGKTEALRKAKLEMLATKYRHPFYWASFVLQGK